MVWRNPSEAVGENVGKRPHRHAEVSEKCLHAADALGPVEIERIFPVRRFLDDGRGKIGLQNFLDCDWTRARAAASMRSGKRLVQVQVHDVDAEVSRPRDAHQRVHVGPIHVDEPAARVNNLHNFRDIGFKNPERIGIGQHDAGDFGIHGALEIGEVDAALRIRLDGAGT